MVLEGKLAYSRLLYGGSVRYRARWSVGACTNRLTLAASARECVAEIWHLLHLSSECERLFAEAGAR